MPERRRLPARREQVTVTVAHGGRVYQVSVGWDPADAAPAGRPMPLEVFVSGGKGQEAELLDDAAVLISLALQHGIAPADLAHSMGRAPAPGDALGPARAPASMIGRVVDLLNDEALALRPGARNSTRPDEATREQGGADG